MANYILGLKPHLAFKKTKGCSPYMHCMYVSSAKIYVLQVFALFYEISFDQVITFKLPIFF